MVQIIEAQPDDSSFDEILRELAFARMIDRGLADIDQGRVIGHEEVPARACPTGGTERLARSLAVESLPIGEERAGSSCRWRGIES
jgi:hypothetical protein